MNDTTDGDDAQRHLEQRALKNVRGLVDKIQDEEQAQARLQKRILSGFGVALVVLIVLFASGAFKSTGGETTEIVVAPPAAKK